MRRVSRKAQNRSGSVVNTVEAGSGSLWLGASILALAGLIVLSLPRLSLAQVTVSSVLAPVPPGSPPGGEIFLQATVTASGPRPATVMFYLAQDEVPGPHDILLATARVRLAPRLMAPRTVGVAAHIGSQVPPGFYFVLACTYSECAVSPGTIQIMSEGVSAIDQSSGTTSETAPAPEYFPENPGDGMTVDSPIACPLSTHGQWPGSCVWVTTKVISVKFPSTADGLFYCPKDRPYPFQVALSDDPLWEDLSTPVSAYGRTNSVSFTKYKTNIFKLPYSYAGFGPNTTPPNRGYAEFRFGYCLDVRDPCNDEIFGKARFLCSDKPTKGAQP